MTTKKLGKLATIFASKAKEANAKIRKKMGPTKKTKLSVKAQAIVDMVGTGDSAFGCKAEKVLRLMEIVIGEKLPVAKEGGKDISERFMVLIPTAQFSGHNYVLGPSSP